MNAIRWLLGTILIVAAVLLGALAALGYFVVPNPTSESKYIAIGLGVVAFILLLAGSSLRTPRQRITLRNFERITIGDSLDDCIGCLGYDGRHMSTSRERVKNRIVERKQVFWENQNGSYCEVIFENDRVASLSQFGLS